MPTLKNSLIAGVLLYGAVFALYGNEVINQYGLSRYGSESSAFTHLTRGASEGYSATEGSAGYASDYYSAQEYAQTSIASGGGGKTGFTGIPSEAFSARSVI